MATVQANDQVYNEMQQRGVPNTVENYNRLAAAIQHKQRGNLAPISNEEHRQGLRPGDLSPPIDASYLDSMNAGAPAKVAPTQQATPPAPAQSVQVGTQPNDTVEAANTADENVAQSGETADPAMVADMHDYNNQGDSGETENATDNQAEGGVEEPGNASAVTADQPNDTGMNPLAAGVPLAGVLAAILAQLYAPHPQKGPIKPGGRETVLTKGEASQDSFDKNPSKDGTSPDEQATADKFAAGQAKREANAKAKADANKQNLTVGEVNASQGEKDLQTAAKLAKIRRIKPRI